MNQIVLLGPQRSRPTVAAALDSLHATGPVAVISAGWQEREGELDSLAGHLPGIELIDLALYARAEKVFDSDLKLRDAWRQRQDWLKELQRLYRRRLRHSLNAARELNDASGIDCLISEERADALAAVRLLDEQHLGKIRKAQHEHWHQWHSAQPPAVAGQRREIGRQLERCNTVLIAGGHVAVLLNRLRLFDMAELIGQRAIVAWSAGAMALSEKVVLFHDFPPQGAGNAEVFDAGLSAFPGMVVLPDANHRLALGDKQRVSMLASRLAPATSMTLDESSILQWDGHGWQMTGPARMLSSDGTVRIVAQ